MICFNSRVRYLQTQKAKTQVYSAKSEIDEVAPTDADIRFDDFQEIQLLQDKCHKLCHALNLNSFIIEKLNLSFPTLGSKSSHTTCVGSVSGKLSVLGIEGFIQSRRANIFLKRIEGTMQLVSTGYRSEPNSHTDLQKAKSILDFRCLRSLQHNSRMTAKIARLSKDDNSMIMEFTRKASMDADVLKILTFLALIFLPASFVSVSSAR